MVLLGGFALFALMLFMHPYVTYPLSLLLLPARPVRKGTGDGGPSLTLMFSAFNEERALPQKLANIRAIKALHPEVEMLAYCDFSSDDTLKILQDAGDVLTVIAATQRTGKATGMARMAARATGDVCIFTDANVPARSLKHYRAASLFRRSDGWRRGRIVEIHERRRKRDCYDRRIILAAGGAGQGAGVALRVDHGSGRIDLCHPAGALSAGPAASAR